MNRTFRDGKYGKPTRSPYLPPYPYLRCNPSVQSGQRNWDPNPMRNYRRPWAEPSPLKTRSGPSYSPTEFQYPMPTPGRRPQSRLARAKRPPTMMDVSWDFYLDNRDEASVQTDEVEFIEPVPDSLIDLETDTESPDAPLIPSPCDVNEGDDANNTYATTVILNIYDEVRQISKFIANKFGDSKDLGEEGTSSAVVKQSVSVGTSTSCILLQPLYKSTRKEQSTALPSPIAAMNFARSTISSRANSLPHIKPLMSRRGDSAPKKHYQTRIVRSNSKLQSLKLLPKRSSSLQSSPPPKTKGKSKQVKIGKPTIKRLSKTRRESSGTKWPPYQPSQLAMFPKVDRLLDEARTVLGIPKDKSFLRETHVSEGTAIMDLDSARNNESDSLNQADDMAVNKRLERPKSRRTKNRLSKNVRDEIIKELKRGIEENQSDEESWMHTPASAVSEEKDESVPELKNPLEKENLLVDLDENGNELHAEEDFKTFYELYTKKHAK